MKKTILDMEKAGNHCTTFPMIVPGEFGSKQQVSCAL